MCRSIKQLREGTDVATPEEIEAAALQFVRKVSGYRAPSKKNAVAFETAVDEITDSAARLLVAITLRSKPRGAPNFKERWRSEPRLR